MNTVTLWLVRVSLPPGGTNTPFVALCPTRAEAEDFIAQHPMPKDSGIVYFLPEKMTLRQLLAGPWGLELLGVDDLVALAEHEISLPDKEEVKVADEEDALAVW